jgi:hypothetical protein
MSNLFNDWFPDEVIELLEETDASLYDVVPEEIFGHLQDIEDDRSHWEQYDEMPWNQ